MSINVLMIALNRGYLPLFQQPNSPYELYVLEEREIYEADPQGFQIPGIKAFRCAAYQQNEQFLDIALDWHEQIGFDVVVPGMDYSVPAAHRFARAAGLTTLPSEAIAAFTDKYLLRTACQNIGVQQPSYASVTSEQDIAAFFQGQPIVLKPRNRHASVGVIRIDRPEQIAVAWNETTSSSEGARTASRDLAWKYMVEAYIDGPEVSVETIVAQGRVLFHNVTAKDVVKGRYFTEIGHTVPAVLDHATQQSLLQSVERMLIGLQATVGLFHSEWKLTPSGPTFIECAARAPGDLVPQLIETAYEFNLYEAYLQTLLGQAPSLPSQPQSVAAVRFFRPPPGIFRYVEGLEILDRLPQVFEHYINQANLKPGHPVPSFANSWNRAGYYALRCETHAELQAIVEQIDQQLRFVVDQA